MTTVDVAQGDENEFVLLDLVSPSGMQYFLGFFGDPRMCVAKGNLKRNLKCY